MKKDTPSAPYVAKRTRLSSSAQQRLRASTLERPTVSSVKRIEAVFAHSVTESNSSMLNTNEFLRTLQRTERVWLQRLLNDATRIRSRAQARCSGFAVGASLIDAKGDLTSGVNVESSSYGLTICAERSALVSALTQAKRDFRAIAIVADTEEPTAPCGACRQLLHDYAPDLLVIMGNLKGKIRIARLEQLLPHAFGFDALG